MLCKLIKQPGAFDVLPPEVIISLNSQNIVVGRTAESTIQIEDKTISKQHCILEIHSTVGRILEIHSTVDVQTSVYNYTPR